jgi:hypothetical protein
LAISKQVGDDRHVEPGRVFDIDHGKALAFFQLLHQGGREIIQIGRVGDAEDLVLG